MRRWMLMATLIVTLLATALWGQRGGHGGSPAHGSGGLSGAPHGGTYWGGGFHGGFGYGRYPGRFPYYPGRYGYYHPGRFPWWGYGYGLYGYPWGSLGWYGGFDWSDAFDSSPAQAYPAYTSVYPDSSNVPYDQQRQIDRLNDEVARLRAEQQSGGGESSGPRSSSKAEIRATTVLVYRDHHSEEIENYAIVGKTLWVFTEQRARKIPVAELNLPATTKANEARGIDFRPPPAQ
jgi:hypothetical protein